MNSSRPLVSKVTLTISNYLTITVVLLSCFLAACGGGAGGGGDSGSSSGGNSNSGGGGTATNRILELSWDPNPASDSVSGYIVYSGSSASNATQQVTDLSVSSGVFNPNAPVVSFNAGFDLGLNPGDQVCFRLKAYNTAGLSDYSVAACAII